MSSSRKGPIVLTVVLVIAALAGGVWFFFLRSDAPPEVDLNTATDQLTSTTEDSSQESTTTSVPTNDGINGTWLVDYVTGDFDFETATGSFAGYRVTEELAQIGSTEAVGRTGEVTGVMVIEDNTLVATEIEVLLTGLVSDKPRRDNRVQDALSTDDWPSATFELSEDVELPADASDGEAISIEAPGVLMINGVKNDVTANLEAQLVDGTAVVVGSIDIDFTDFDITAPTAPVVLSVSNDATIEFQLLFKPEAIANADAPTTSIEPTTTITISVPELSGDE